jgi:hypothetical protein
LRLKNLLQGSPQEIDEYIRFSAKASRSAAISRRCTCAAAYRATHVIEDGTMERFASWRASAGMLLVKQ